MTKKKPKFETAVLHVDDIEEREEYFSQSSIDTPPISKIPDDKSEPTIDNNLYRGERIFEVEFAVVIKPKEGKPIKIPLLADTLRGTLIEEYLVMSLRDERNKSILNAVLDNPKDRVLSDNLINDDKQGDLF